MKKGPATESSRIYLTRHREAWERKPFLRQVYRNQFHSRLLTACTGEGALLELASGPGFLKDSHPSLIATDITLSDKIDVAADACRLPFKNACVANVVGIDALHHFPRPSDCLSEAERVLKPGGRLVLIEPWITPFSYLLYRFFHQEDCRFDTDLYQPWQGRKSAMDGNQAIPFRFFGGGKPAFAEINSGLRIKKIEPFAFWCYLGSMGFKSANFIPGRFFPWMSRWEEATRPLWRKGFALKALIVLEKKT